MKARTKYGSNTTRYLGMTFHSKKEANYARQLDLLKHAKDEGERVLSWERQVKVPLGVNGKHVCNWYVDFLVRFADGRDEYHEVKGFATPEYVLKRKLFEAVYPTLTLKVIR